MQVHRSNCTSLGAPANTGSRRDNNCAGDGGPESSQFSGTRDAQGRRWRHHSPSLRPRRGLGTAGSLSRHRHDRRTRIPHHPSAPKHLADRVGAGGARSRQLLDKVVQARGAGRALAGELVDGCGVAVEDDTLVTSALKAPHDVGANASEPIIPSCITLLLLIGCSQSVETSNLGHSSPGGKFQAAGYSHFRMRGVELQQSA
jgi:hypothetical protein